METVFQGRRIQWDDAKNEINRRKHGFSLEEARLVFADPARGEAVRLISARDATAHERRADYGYT